MFFDLVIILKNKKIAVTHKPAEAKKLAQTGKYNLVIHGHDHKPWQSFIGACELLNPGNLADIRYPATFAIYNLGPNKPELFILERLKSDTI